MANTQPNPASPLPSATSASRIITDTARYRSPTGQTVDILTSDVTIQDAGGTWRTEMTKECVPPLADGRVPQSTNDIRECHRCVSLIHVDTSFICPACGFTYCTVCAAQIPSDDAEPTWLCIVCAAKATEAPLTKIMRFIWG